MDTRLEAPRLTTALPGPLSEVERRLLAQPRTIGLAAFTELEQPENAPEPAAAPADTTS